MYTDTELYHFRTKGSVNGIRQYQNKDGTWTELGKRRRRIGEHPKGSKDTEGSGGSHSSAKKITKPSSGGSSEGSAPRRSTAGRILKAAGGAVGKAAVGTVKAAHTATGTAMKATYRAAAGKISSMLKEHKEKKEAKKRIEEQAKEIQAENQRRIAAKKAEDERRANFGKLIGNNLPLPIRGHEEAKKLVADPSDQLSKFSNDEIKALTDRLKLENSYIDAVRDRYGLMTSNELPTRGGDYKTPDFHPHDKPPVEQVLKDPKTEKFLQKYIVEPVKPIAGEYATQLGKQIVTSIFQELGVPVEETKK